MFDLGELPYTRVWRTRLTKPLHEWPQLTNEAIKWLDFYLTPDSLVFEWGSGGSTLYIAKKVRKVISIEHNAQWWKKVTSAAKEWGIENCQCMLVEPEPVFESDVPRVTLSDLELCRSSYGALRQFRERLGVATFNYEKYVKAICEYPDATFDLVLVDGRARASCILYGHSKVKPGGFLMLDDAERPRYKNGKSILSRWKVTDFSGTGKYAEHESWSTMVWRKS